MKTSYSLIYDLGVIMAEKEKLKVELCMGSSCFARGNSSNLIGLEEYIEHNGLADRIDLEGHLCLGKCSTGPHLTIGDKEYSGITDPDAVADLIREALEREDAESDIH